MADLLPPASCAVPAAEAAEQKRSADADAPPQPAEPAPAPAPAPAPPPLNTTTSRPVKIPRQANPLPLEVTVPAADCVVITPAEAAFSAGDRVQLSAKDKAARMTLSADAMSVTSHKGYRTCRATHGVHAGTWYYEITITHLGATGHCRLGWCTKRAELNAPVGFDRFGFAYRDVDGSKVYKSFREPYGAAYTDGDVIGVLLHLPEGGKALTSLHKQQVRYKGALYYIDSPDPDPEPLPGSFLGFFKNGEWQGRAYTDILEGTYYPAAALYTLPEQAEGATVAFNFAPESLPDLKAALGEDAPAPAPAPRPFAEAAQLPPPPAAPLTPPAPVAATVTA